MKLTRNLSTLAVAALATLSSTSTAAPGDLDLTFGGTGKVTTAIWNIDEGRSVVLQNDGKIVVAGASSDGNLSKFAVVRYNPNGSVDTTFNGTGKVTTAIGNGYDYGYSGTVQSDGKIVVAGLALIGNTYDFAVVRYNLNGTLDTSFNGTGKVTTAIGPWDDVARSVIVQSDGKIIVAGDASNGIGSFFNFAVVRYNPNGSLDTGFGSGGKVTTDFGGISSHGWQATLQSDGKIVVVGDALNGSYHNFAVVRYNPNGSLDTTFNGTGKVKTAIGTGNDYGFSVAALSDHKVIVAGSSDNGSNVDFALVRYNSNGTLDTTFNGTGKVTTGIGTGDDRPASMAVQSDGKIVVGGSSSNSTSGGDSDFALVRYNANGSLDTTFHGTGKVTTHFENDDLGQGVALQDDGKIVLAGSSGTGSKYRFAVARYEIDPDSDGDGIADRFETGTGIYVSPTNTGTNPNNPDSDSDGLNDGREVNTYHSNPNIKDTDGDGFEDGFEVATGFDPTSAASAPDLVSTILAAVEYRFTGASGVSYRIEASTDLATWAIIETNIIGTGGVIVRLYSIEGQPKRYFRSRRN